MATAKILSNDNLHKMINLLMSIKSESAEQIDKCISVWTADTTYKKDSVVLVLEGNQYSEYCCDTTHISKATFEEDKTYWTLVSCVDFEGYTEEELLDMLNLTEEELQNLQNIINDNEVQTDHVWSSSKVYAELLTVLSESKNFTIAEIAKIVSFSYKVVTSEDEVIDDKAIYLIENSSGTHDMYLLIDGSPSKVGNTSIDLSDYLKKENIVDTFDGTATYTDGDKVFSTKASKSMYDDLNDKKISKSNIVTTLLNDTVTDEQVVSARIVHELTKGKNLKTYTDYPEVGIDRTNFTLEEVATKLTDASALMVGTNNQTANIFPKVYGHFIALRKSNDKTKFFFFPNEDNEANAIYFCGYHPRIGVTEWSKVCTTSVPDVPKTKITPIDTTYYSTNDENGSWYVVKNGWCYVNLRVKCNTVNTLTSNVFFDSIPKSMGYVDALLFPISDTHNKPIQVNIFGNIQLFLRHGEAGINYLGSFSYPVAEDWRP